MTLISCSMVLHAAAQQPDSTITDSTRIKNCCIQTKITTKPWQGVSTLPWLTQDKLFTTAAVSTVSGSLLAKNPETNSSNALGGLLAGLISRQNSSEPGSDDATLNIRGFSSYNALSPKIYVDGIERNLASIDPLELESVTILKDNAANGTFGIRGSGRSVMATTRRGVANTNEITFTAQQGIQYRGAAPEMLGAQQYMQLYNEAAANDGLPAKYSPAQIAAYNDPQRNRLLYPDVNWYDELVKKSTTQSRYNLSLSGGNANFRYFALLGYLHQGGIFNYGDVNQKDFNFRNNTDFKRYNFRTNLDLQVTKRLTASLDLSGRAEDRNYPGTAVPTIFNSISTYPAQEFPMLYPDGKIGGNTQFLSNPYGLLTATGYNTEFRRTFLGTARLKQELDMITPGLSISAAFAFDNYFFVNGGRTKTFAVYAQEPDSSFSAFGVDGLLNARGRSNDQDRQTTFYTNLAYERTFGKHMVNGFINYNQSYENAGGFDFPYASQGIASRLTYIFNKKYVAEFNGSYSGSENLPPGKRFGFFPSFSAAWIVSAENFMQEQHVIDFLKLRASYGYTGNAEITGSGTRRFLYQDYFETGNSYTFGSGANTLTGRRQSRLANPDVTWETLRTLNAGLDLYFLREHFNVSVDVFKEKRTNILTDPNLSSTIGITLAPVNAGIIENKGIDWELGYKLEKSKWGFQVSFLGSYNENKLIYNNEVYRAYDYQKRTGRMTGAIFGLQQEGFYTAKEVGIINSEMGSAPAQKSIPQPTFGAVKAGDMKYKDQNGDNLIDTYDDVYLGTGLPKLYYGIRAGIHYGAFDMTLLFQGAGGNIIDLRNVTTTGFQGGSRPSTYVLDRWTPATAETAGYPRLSVVSNALNYRSADFWIAKGDYIKLKNAEIGFTTPVRYQGRLIIKKMRVFANASNLFTWSKLPVKWMDPEMSAAGIGSYPRMKMVNTGVQFTF